MSKYFFDTEFITGFKKPLSRIPTIGNFNKEEFFIQLVSIGIVCEDGREYYAISNEFNPKLADDWVTKNVLDPIHVELYRKQSPFAKTHFNPGFKQLLNTYGKPIHTIRRQIVEFMGGGIDDLSPCFWIPDDTEIYAYYADYDWVVFCNMFGRMIDLPAGMPMYCRDLKQMLDEKAERDSMVGMVEKNTRKLMTAKNVLNVYKNSPQFPKQKNEHNALDDAKWNFELYKFL